MNKIVERIIWFIALSAFSSCSWLAATNRANDTIDNAQATSAALQNSLNELLSVTQPPDLSNELATLQAANSTIAAYNEEQQMTETARWQTTLTPTIGFTPTAVNLPSTYTPQSPSPTPTQIPNCYPSDLIEVVVTRIPKANLWNEELTDVYTDENGNRIQYPTGSTFFVYEDEVLTDDGDVFYEVIGPRGAGLFVSENVIKLFNAEPDVLYCN